MLRRSAAVAFVLPCIPTPDVRLGALGLDDKTQGVA